MVRLGNKRGPKPLNHMKPLAEPRHRTNASSWERTVDIRALRYCLIYCTSHVHMLVARAWTDGHVTRAGSRTASANLPQRSADSLKSSHLQRPCHSTAPCFGCGRYGLSPTGTRVPATSWYHPSRIFHRFKILQHCDLGACSKLVTSLLARSQAHTSSGNLHLASPWTETTLCDRSRPFRRTVLRRPL